MFSLCCCQSTLKCLNPYQEVNIVSIITFQNMPGWSQQTPFYDTEIIQFLIMTKTINSTCTETEQKYELYQQLSYGQATTYLKNTMKYYKLCVVRMSLFASLCFLKSWMLEMVQNDMCNGYCKQGCTTSNAILNTLYENQKNTIKTN